MNFFCYLLVQIMRTVLSPVLLVLWLLFHGCGSGGNSSQRTNNKSAKIYPAEADSKTVSTNKSVDPGLVKIFEGIADKYKSKGPGIAIFRPRKGEKARFWTVLTDADAPGELMIRYNVIFATSSAATVGMGDDVKKIPQPKKFIPFKLDSFPHWTNEPEYMDFFSMFLGIGEPCYFSEIYTQCREGKCQAIEFPPVQIRDSCRPTEIQGPPVLSDSKTVITWNIYRQLRANELHFRKTTTDKEIVFDLPRVVGNRLKSIYETSKENSDYYQLMPNRIFETTHYLQAEGDEFRAYYILNTDKKCPKLKFVYAHIGKAQGYSWLEDKYFFVLSDHQIFPKMFNENETENSHPVCPRSYNSCMVWEWNKCGNYGKGESVGRIIWNEI